MRTNITPKLGQLSVLVANRVTALLAYWDSSLVCRYANTAYVGWFGKSVEDVINKTTAPELLGTLFEQQKPHIEQVLAGKEQTFETALITPNGETRYFLVNYFPDNVDDEVKGYFVHVADIHSIKLLEKELIRSNETVNEQNRRLLNFANIVSHNLKSYAANLDSIVDILLNPTSEEERDIMLQYLKKMSKSFGDTVTNLNEIAKAHNQGMIKPELVNLHDYINRVLEILRIQITTTNATIINNVDTGYQLLANPAYLESILLNFLTNAIKYRHPQRPPVVEVSCVEKNGELMLSIKDNGLGINLDKYGKNLFGLYQTFHKNAEAHGVGLFITKFQVEAMGGRIEVESSEGNGTTFSVYFKKEEA
jgi:PAS domain S-box-containing protein